jgi:hypothetical protein
MKKIFFLILIATTIVACEDRGENDTVPVELAKHYIDRFVDCKQLKISSWTGDFFIDEKLKIVEQTEEKIENVITLKIDGLPENKREETYYIVYHADYSDGFTPDDAFYARIRGTYLNYIEQIGDTCFNMYLPGGVSSTITAITIPLKTISITSNKDFGKEYPAGSEMNGLFTVFFDDAYATIKNGYKQVEGTYTIYSPDNKFQYKIPHSIYKAKLSEVNFAEHPFITNEWSCISNAVPEKTDEYTFHIKVSMDDGTTMEGDAPPIKIKGSIE